MTLQYCIYRSEHLSPIRDKEMLYHAANREVGALLVFLPIFEHTVECKDSRRYKIVRLQEIKVLYTSAIG